MVEGAVVVAVVAVATVDNEDGVQWRWWGGGVQWRWQRLMEATHQLGSQGATRGQEGGVTRGRERHSNQPAQDNERVVQ